MYNLHVYIDGDYNRDVLSYLRLSFTPACTQMQRYYMFVMYYYQILLKSWGFEFCFWPAQCIQRQARISDNVEWWNFSSIIVKMRFIDNVVYCNSLRSFEAPISWSRESNVHRRNSCSDVHHHHAGPFTWSKKSKTFHAKCMLKINWEKKGLWEPSSLYGCYRSQSYSWTYTPRSWYSFKNRLMFFMITVFLRNLII